jgi:hypothetical protein
MVARQAAGGGGEQVRGLAGPRREAAPRLATVRIAEARDNVWSGGVSSYDA